MVLTLFILLYISLENKQSNKANVKHIWGYTCQFVINLMLVHWITTFCHSLIIVICSTSTSSVMTGNDLLVTFMNYDVSARSTVELEVRVKLDNRDTHR